MILYAIAIAPNLQDVAVVADHYSENDAEIENMYHRLTRPASSQLDAFQASSQYVQREDAYGDFAFACIDYLGCCPHDTIHLILI